MAESAQELVRVVKPQVGVKPLLGVALAAAIASAMGSYGCFYLMFRRGLAPVAAQQVKSNVPAKTKQIVMEPLLVNLADPDGGAYLRVGVTLNVADDGEKTEKKDEEKDSQAGVRDAVLEVLTSFHSTELISEAGKAELKKRIREALVAKDPLLHVQDVYFTEFLVQR